MRNMTETQAISSRICFALISLLVIWVYLYAINMFNFFVVGCKYVSNRISIVLSNFRLFFVARYLVKKKILPIY